MTRISIFLFGVFSYLVFFGVFVYAIGFVGGYGAPTSLDATPKSPLGFALMVDLGLLAAFALQHSGMARPAFKRWWTKIVPVAAERSVYVLFSSLAMILLFILWQPIGGVIWETEGAARASLIGLNLFGWAFLFYATWLINHFDLFGLSQVWRRLRKQSEYVATFRTPGLYGLMRHPIYVGWLIIFWAAPTMTIAHLIFAIGTTIYMLGAIQLEERDLIAQFGKDYVEYKKRVPALIPRLGSPQQTQNADVIALPAEAQRRRPGGI